MKDNGRERTAAVVWETAKGAMYRAAYSVLKNQEDAEDAVMDAMVRIIKSEEKFSGLASNEMTALAVIYARNTAINIYNANRKRPFPIEELPDVPGMTSAEEEAEGRDAEERMLRLIELMPPSYRDALMLRVRFGMSVTEIAEVLGIGNGAVRTRLSRARQWLKKHEGGEDT